MNRPDGGQREHRTRIAPWIKSSRPNLSEGAQRPSSLAAQPQVYAHKNRKEKPKPHPAFPSLPVRRRSHTFRLLPDPPVHGRGKGRDLAPALEAGDAYLLLLGRRHEDQGQLQLLLTPVFHLGGRPSSSPALETQDLNFLSTHASPSALSIHRLPRPPSACLAQGGQFGGQVPGPGLHPSLVTSAAVVARRCRRSFVDDLCTPASQADASTRPLQPLGSILSGRRQGRQ